MQGTVDAEELLAVEKCKIVLVPGGGGSAGHAVAEGTLRILALKLAPGSPAESASREVVLSVGGTAGDAQVERRIAEAQDAAVESSGFYYPVLPETPFWVADGGACLTFPVLAGDGSIYGLVADGGTDGAAVERVASQLQAAGCSVGRADGKQQQGAAAVPVPPAPGQRAERVAGAVEQTGYAVASAIGLASSALTWGIRQATDKAKESKMMEPKQKPMEVGRAAEHVSSARQATFTVVQLSGVLVESLASAAAGMGERVGEMARPSPDSKAGKSQMVANATLVGKSSVAATLTVFDALRQAADALVQDTADSGAELVGHKYGDEAGTVTRDGVHCVGNLLKANGNVSAKAVGKTVAKTAGVALVESALGEEAPASTSGPPKMSLGPAPAAAQPTGGGIRLGPS
eukprot:gnl/TRDRNA2_/TRDRNA2_136574_c0_seq1.p1 gnl/TRDRNA2_/TRDRNA2_136574_c0~~gnl/TRDRNA2_/TRDRNA2_136574_c0_seq1.p1  ORF type:complete len:404 (+),score=84.53 gnl/TRDRNA2_/TRDRNA2_136574_c0_seq1:90-1301(+)